MPCCAWKSTCAPPPSSAPWAAAAIGELLRLSIGQSHAAKTLAIILLLLVTVIAVDQCSAWLRRRLIGAQSFTAHP